jgi:hypothetical protein
MEMSQRNQCIAILNKKKMFFFRILENRRAKQVLSARGWVLVRAGSMWGEGISG